MTKNERIHEMLSAIEDMLGDITVNDLTPVTIVQAIDDIYDKVGDVQTMLDQPAVYDHPGYAVVVQLPHTVAYAVDQTRILRHDGRTAFTRNEAEALAASVTWNTSEHMVGQVVTTYESTANDSELREEYQ